METQNSQVEFYLDLYESLIRCDPYNTNQKKHIDHDIATLRRRTIFEGLSFLTKTLPKLGKALDDGLASQKLEVPIEFKRSHRNRNIPAFMQGYFNLLFDSDGCLLEKAPALVVNHLRQVLFLVYKLETRYSSKDERRVIDAFVETDNALELSNSLDVLTLVETSASITGMIFSDFNAREIQPRHGPGSVATGERLEDKWSFQRLYSDIHQVYPYYEYFVAGGADELRDRLDWYKSLERRESGVAKVILVPKDSRGPRLISCEPLEFQFVQQGLGRKLMSFLEDSCEFTRGRINFRLQSVNQKLAVEGSIDRSWATIDLSEASDRVSLDLVSRVFSKTSLLKYLLGTRSRSTLLPDGRIHQLKKFAPMGSALCFPVEAYIFWVVAAVSVSRALHIPWRDAGRKIHVYGDDIVIPNAWFDQVVAGLTSVGLVVNSRKSCSEGYFRESCGIDAFHGVVVTPFRVRTPWSDRPTDAAVYVSYIELANSFSLSYPATSDFLWGRLEKIYGFIPYCLRNSPFPGKIRQRYFDVLRLNAERLKIRWHSSFQLFRFKVRILRSRRIRSRLDGWTRLLRDLLVPPFEDPSVVVVPRSTSLKLGWRSI